MLSRAGRSCQFGRTSAPMIPQPVQTMRGPRQILSPLNEVTPLSEN
jgi:hypothetical protein